MIISGPNELERVGASVANIGISITKGAGNALEAIVDGTYSGITWLASQIKVNDKEAIKYMQQNTMSFVATEHVNNAYYDFYNNNKVGKNIEKKSYDPFKSTGAVYQLTQGIAYETTLVATSALLGGGTAAYAATAGLAGMGRETQHQWAQARDNAKGMEWRTEDTFNKGIAAGTLNATWEAATHAGAAQAIISKIPNTSNAIFNAGARVVGETAENAADTPVRAVINTLVYGQDFGKAFEEQGGWSAVTADALLGLVGGTIGEVIQTKHGKYNDNNVKKRNSSKQVSNLEAIHFWEIEGKSNRYSGTDQGLFRKLPSTNRDYYEYLKSTAMEKYHMTAQDVTKLMDMVDEVGGCSYATVANVLVDKFKNNPDAFKYTFGFPMTIDDSKGVSMVNGGELLLDLYYWVNHSDNGGSIIRKGNNTNHVMNFDPKTGQLISAELQRYLSGKNEGDWMGILEDYLKSKNIGLEAKTKIVFKTEPGDANSGNILKMEDQIMKSWLDGKSVTMGIYNTNRGVVRFMDNETKTTYVTTGNWTEGSGHAVFVESIRWAPSIQDRALTVSSWGKELDIPYRDLMNNADFQIRSIDIYS